MNLQGGDLVKLTNAEGRETVCIIMVDHFAYKGKARLNSVVTNNLNVKDGDEIKIEKVPVDVYGKRVDILLWDENANTPNGSLIKLGNEIEYYLKQYFCESYRPIHKDDIFTVQMKEELLKFFVHDSEPSPFCIVVPDTKVNLFKSRNSNLGNE